MLVAAFANNEPTVYDMNNLLSSEHCNSIFQRSTEYQTHVFLDRRSKVIEYQRYKKLYSN